MSDYAEVRPHQFIHDCGGRTLTSHDQFWVLEDSAYLDPGHFCPYCGRMLPGIPERTLVECPPPPDATETL